jgi:hypothetical protein
MNVEALEARLRIVEEEILSLTNLAAGSPDPKQQDNYYRLAHDLQRDTRELRLQIKKISESRASDSQRPTVITLV